jgi:hypothetical protein
MCLYAITITLSAFLLFQVQPLIGKYILPWFGGAPAVWTTCMLFFQGILLAGYAYAHFLGRRAPRFQLLLHGLLLLLSFIALPITPEPAFRQTTTHHPPTATVLLLLIVNIGLPYFLLSSTAPLIQRWFSLCFNSASPYRLYALSNLGSMTALLSYPLLFEPAFTLRRQTVIWTSAYLMFALLVFACILHFAHKAAAAPVTPHPNSGSSDVHTGGAPRRIDLLLWLGLSMIGSIMLLATTNQLSQEVAAVPFIWIVPLALYLLSFILSFEGGWYDRRWCGVLLAISLPMAIHVLGPGANDPYWVQCLFYNVVLFACCMTCHGELARSKPHPSHLTIFYLLVAVGGALGGFFVALLSPCLFNGYWEYHIGLGSCCAMIFAIWRREGLWYGKGRFRVLQISVSGLLATLAFALAHDIVNKSKASMASQRNFFGVLRVTETQDSKGPLRMLKNGRIIHGLQYLSPENRKLPTTYYGPDSGAGLALQHHPRRTSSQLHEQHLRVGIIGLATGTLATYGRPGDYFRFYEINPAAIDFSRRYFSYLRDAEGKIDVIFGDARIRLEEELQEGSPQLFDVLIMDAFSGDAIPVHLLTREAIDIYWKHLRKDGLLLLHITNQFVDLEPLAIGAAREHGCRILRVVRDSDPTQGTFWSKWMILTSSDAFGEESNIFHEITDLGGNEAASTIWTDDYASLWSVIRM